MVDDLLTEVKRLISNANQTYYEWLKNEEMEATERQKKIAQIQALTSALQARRDIAEVYSNNFLDERKALREMAEDVLSTAISTGNQDLAEISLNLIKFEYEKDFFGKMNHII